MVDMARKEDSSGKIQGNSLPEIRAGLKSATLYLADAVKRDGRPLEEGPVISRLAAWFLLLNDSDRAEIIEVGHKLVEHLKESDDHPKVLDGRESEKLHQELFGGRSIYPSSVEPVAALDDAAVDAPEAVGHHGVGVAKTLKRKKAGDGVGTGRPLSEKK